MQKHREAVRCTRAAAESKRIPPKAAGELFTMVAKTISTTRALVADGIAVGRLLDEVPDAEEIRTELDKPYFTRRWQQSMSRSFWITSDGTTAVCLTLSGLDLDETVALWVCFDAHRRRAGFELSAHTLGEIIESEIGLIVGIEN